MLSRLWLAFTALLTTVYRPKKPRSDWVSSFSNCL